MGKMQLERLRAKMKERGVSAYLTQNSDFHASEYIGDAFKAVEFLSNFTGSAATLVVLMDRAALWTDSRYFLQASMELEGTGIDLCKMGEPGTPTITEYLKQALKKEDILSGDGRTLSAKQLLDFREALGGITFLDEDLAGEVWENRPALPTEPVYLLGEQYTGKSAAEKLSDLRKLLAERKIDAHLMTTLDDIAWALNIRGADVEYNPVTLSYFAVTSDKAFLLIDAHKLSAQVRSYLEKLGVEILPYENAAQTLKACLSGKSVLLMPEKVSYTIHQALESECKLVFGQNPTIYAKAIKNETELSNIRRAHLKDGVALTKMLYRLKTGENRPVSEYALGEQLDALRKEQEGCIGPSFSTIAGFGPHGAIVHYSATPESDAQITEGNLLLLDSGGQYFEGTTDVTRTVVIGQPSEEQKKYFTLVLQGTINLADVTFPKGVCGHHLDVLAHMPLWAEGVDYGHGTGHGIGYMLCVHEPPVNISWSRLAKNNATTLEAGMVLSDEPGLYLTGKFGIRIENQLVCVPAAHEGYLKFETLTVAPIDLDLVDTAYLSESARNWLNTYHTHVYEMLAPQMTDAERAWLKNVTRAI